MNGKNGKIGKLKKIADGLLLKDQAFRRRILGFVLLACVIIGAVGELSRHIFKNQDTLMNELVSDQFPKAMLIGKLISENHAISHYLLSAQTQDGYSANRNKDLKLVVDMSNQFTKNLARLSEYPFDARRSKNLTELKLNSVKVSDTLKKILDILGNDRSETVLASAKTAIEDYNKISNSILKQLQQLDESSVDTIVDLVLNSQAQAQKFVRLLKVVGLLGAVVLLILGWFFSKSLVSLLAKITELLSEHAFKLSGDSVQISSSSSTVATSATTQASALQETAASIQEVSAMITANSENAHRSKDHTLNVETVSRETKKSMDDLKAAMNEIRSSNRRVSDLTQLIEGIRTKTKVIDEIVFKTQLLSFNASIEASRAGKYGTSFSVIAQEIGVLAQISGKAANEISGIVREGSDEVKAVATDTKSCVEKGETLAEKTALKMTEVLESIGGIRDATGKIVEACQEQSAAMGQINAAVTSINHSTSDFSGKAKDSEELSHRLTQRADSLLSLVRDLNLIVKGDTQKQASRLRSVPKEQTFESDIRTGT